MRSSLRPALLACASIVALALAAPGLAAYTPRLVVTTSATAAGGSTAINVAQGTDDDPTARIVIYAPPGFTATLSQAASSQVGTVSGRVQAADLGGTIIPVEGTVTVANAAEAAAASAAAAACLGTAAHQAVWLMNLSAARPFPAPVPIFLDPTTGAEQAFGSLKLQICLPPGDVPAGTPGRAVFGINLVEATLTTTAVFAAPAAAGEYRWTGVFTPYTPRTGRPNAAGSVQSQSVARTPARLSLTGKRVVAGGKKRRVTSARLAGQLRAGGAGVSGASVQIVANGRPVGTVRTGAGGTYRITLRLTKTTTFRARATAGATSTTGGCTPIVPSTTCTTVSTASISATSNSVRVARAQTSRKRRR
jgi:hypothetical protein